jgi:hypothetical protein
MVEKSPDSCSSSFQPVGLTNAKSGFSKDSGNNCRETLSIPNADVLLILTPSARLAIFEMLDAGFETLINVIACPLCGIAHSLLHLLEGLPEITRGVSRPL